MNKIFFISKPSPTFGRSAIHGANGGLFGFYRAEKYITALQSKLKLEYTDWSVEIDNTESDIEKLIQRNATILVCAPGLRFQFYTNGFDKENVIHLNLMDYMSNNVNPVINRVRCIESEGHNN